MSAQLSQVDHSTLRAQLVSELADAETRVMISRRFYNDAVRDTLALRRRRPSAGLQLGGTAPEPRYSRSSSASPPENTSYGISLVSPRTPCGRPRRRAPKLSVDTSCTHSMVRRIGARQETRTR